MPVTITPVSILICTRNRASHLRETLASVARLEVPPSLQPELIVVDNASTDATAETVRTLTLPNMPIRLIQETRRGVGHARNTAVREATGDILLFTDDDIRLPANWLAKMCAPILSGEADAVVGKVTIAPHLLRPWMDAFHRTALSSTEAMDEAAPRDMFGANMGFSRSVLATIPAFDPELGPGTAIGALEDILFSWQIAEAGLRTVAVFDVGVEHHFDESRLTRASFVEAARRRGRSLAYIRYHWQHWPASSWTHQKAAWEVWRTPRLVYYKRLLHLALWRLRHWNTYRRSDGITAVEFTMINRIHQIKYFLKTRKQPRNYDKMGLVKKESR